MARTRRVIHYQPEQMVGREQTQVWCGRVVWGAKTTRLADCVSCKDCLEQMEWGEPQTALITSAVEG